MKFFYWTLLAIITCSFALLGCGFKGGGYQDSEKAQVLPVTCIGILPAAPLIEGRTVPGDGPRAKSLQYGVRVMNNIMKRQLKGNDNVRFVGIDQITALELTGGESPLTLARKVGKRIDCNAVLESTVKRFTERVGGRYSVQSPASVAFEMRLISLDTGSIVWSAKFDEVQKSVMGNVLEWKKAKTRSFVWITAEELMQEGISRKFADSPYFYSADGMGEVVPSSEGSL